MGIWDTIQDLVEAAAPWSTAEAEAPAEDKVRFLRFPLVGAAPAQHPTNVHERSISLALPSFSFYIPLSPKKSY